MAEKLLTLDQILAANDQKFETINIPEWGGSVKVKGMDSYTRAVYESKLDTINKQRNQGIESEEWPLIRIRVVAQCLFDANGKHLFDPQNKDQWQQLGSKNASVIDRLFERCLALSGLGKETEGE